MVSDCKVRWGMVLLKEDIKNHLNSLMSVNKAGFIHTTNSKLERCLSHARTKD